MMPSKWTDAARHRLQWLGHGAGALAEFCRVARTEAAPRWRRSAYGEALAIACLRQLLAELYVAPLRWARRRVVTW